MTQALISLLCRLRHPLLLANWLEAEGDEKPGRKGKAPFVGASKVARRLQTRRDVMARQDAPADQARVFWIFGGMLPDFR